MAEYGKHHLADVKVSTKGGGHDHDPPIKRRKGKTGNRRPMVFQSLHHHSTFSYKDGFQLPEAHVRRAQELNMQRFALTEHGNVSSHVKFEQAAEGTGITPIFGVELYCGNVGEDATLSKNHLTVLAKDPAGYKNLLQLVTRTFAEGFYSEPTASGKMLRQHKDGLVVLSGCTGSLLFTSTVGGKKIEPEDASYKRGLAIARGFKRTFGDNYFIEVQAFPELESTCAFNPLAERMARKLGIQLVASMDVHYTTLEENEIQQILHNVRGGTKKTIEEQAREWGYDVPLCPPVNDKVILRRLKATGLSHRAAVEAIKNTNLIANDCNVTLPKLPMVGFKLPKGYDSVQEFWDEALKTGWRARGCHKLPKRERDRYREQLIKEKTIMEDKGFVDYMLIVRDAVLFVKDKLNVFVGPARGSAAASIVCWLLRITEVNPMIFDNLVFERFIDVTREDLPDIDLDFPSEVRPILRDYLVGVYGEGNVNNIGTFTYYRNKLAIDDVARVFRVPKFEVAKVKDFLVERSSGDLRASETIEDTIEQFPAAREVFDKHPELHKSRDLEGNVKSFGVHAAGLVISTLPPDQEGVCAMYEREIPKGSGNIITAVSLDKYDAERQGMIKMDFLGLSTASAIESARKYLDMSNADFYDMPLDDVRTYDGFRANDVVGVFQMDGRACRYVCGAVKPDNFLEVCEVISLGRPGSLHNGAAREYAGIKHGIFRAKEIHPAVDPILKPTKYQIVYQEQILRICREVGNFPWEKTAEIRKIIAKKHGDAAFNRRKAQFMEGAMTVHERFDVPEMMPVTAEKLWGEMITAGSYGFNAAHATAYGFFAYWTMWLKVHHPAVFYATHLEVTDPNNHDRIRDLLRDADKHGVEVRKPSITKSGPNWKPINYRRPSKRRRPAILAGFLQISGVGPSMADDIVKYKAEHAPKAWDDLINIKGVGPKKIENIHEFVDQTDPFGALNLDVHIKQVVKAIKAGDLGDLPVPTHTAADLPYEAESSIALTWLGTPLNRNVRDIFETNRARTGEELDPTKVRAPELNEWVLVTGEDQNDRLIVEVDRFKYPTFKEAIFNARLGRDLLLVEGFRPKQALVRKIKVKRLWVIDPES